MAKGDEIIKPQKTWEPVTIRFPPELRKRLKETAADGKPPESFNSEVLRRLYRSFREARQ